MILYFRKRVIHEKWVIKIHSRRKIFSFQFSSTTKREKTQYLHSIVSYVWHLADPFTFSLHSFRAFLQKWTIRPLKPIKPHKLSGKLTKHKAIVQISATEMLNIFIHPGPEYTTRRHSICSFHILCTHSNLFFCNINLIKVVGLQPHIQWREKQSIEQRTKNHHVNEAFSINEFLNASQTEFRFCANVEL